MNKYKSIFDYLKVVVSNEISLLGGPIYTDLETYNLLFKRSSAIRGFNRESFEI